MSARVFESGRVSCSTFEDSSACTVSSGKVSGRFFSSVCVVIAKTAAKTSSASVTHCQLPPRRIFASVLEVKLTVRAVLGGGLVALGILPELISS